MARSAESLIFTITVIRRFFGTILHITILPESRKYSPLRTLPKVSLFPCPSVWTREILEPFVDDVSHRGRHEGGLSVFTVILSFF